MIAPASIPVGMASPEEAAKLAAYVERLTRYLTISLTERLFGDEDVTDIQINSDGLVWLDRHSAGRTHEGDVLPPERVEMFVNAVAQHLGATFDARNSILEGELPGPVFLGSRLIALGPPTVARPAMVVRKPPLRIYTLDDYRASGILTAAQLDAVLGGILDHRNIVICGATRSGKTTFLNAILAAVADLCPNERLVVVEDTLEVKSSVPNTQTLRTSQYKDHHDLLKATLRLSPDRIVFGEVRDKAVLALLDAWTTDHSGFATFHAADAEGALRRMNRLAMRNRVPPQLELVAEAVHVLVLIQGGSVKRHVREVVRVSGFDPRERGSPSNASREAHPQECSMSIARRIPGIATGTRARWSTLLPARTALRRAWRNTYGRAGALALGALLYSSLLMAGTTGTNMPWNAPLTNLLNNLTGPTARAVVGIGVALCGVIWMMKRHEEGAGRLGQAVVGGALVFGAQVFVGAVGFAGALV